MSGTMRENALSSPNARVARSKRVLITGVFPGPSLIHGRGVEALVLILLPQDTSPEIFKFHGMSSNAAQSCTSILPARQLQ